MADKKISALTSLAQGDVAVTTDVLPIVDTSATETKKVTAAALVGAGLAAGVTSVDINSGSIDGTTIGANSAAAGTFTNLTASGTVSFSGATVSNGGSVTTVDINGGTIDGATIATSDITVGSGKTLNVSAGTLTLADNQISGDKVEGGTINAITINTLTSTAVNATTVDATNVEVTNIKAKDGTAAATIADSTGVVSITANPILSGGTANGVLYLNGSKVATSGSALTFDGTTLANINSDGTGFSTQSAASNFSIMRLGTDSVNGYAFFQSGKSGTGTTLPFAWRQDSNELMRLNSTGLGIGTSSPSYKLDVSGTNDQYIRVTTTTVGGNAAGIRMNSTGSREFGIFSDGTLRFYDFTATAERARIDSSGNLLVGTTTASYDTGKVGSTHKFLNVQAGASLYAVNTLAGNQSAAGNRLGMLAFVNDTNSATYKYSAWILSETEGSTANQLGGRIVFSTTSDASSAGPIERVRIDSSGRLLLNTSTSVGVASSATGLQQIASTAASIHLSLANYSVSSDGGILAFGKSRGTTVGSATIVNDGDNLGEIRFAGADGTDLQTEGGGIRCQVDGTPGSNDMPGRLVFLTTSDGSATPTERARITSGGAACFGTTAVVTTGARAIFYRESDGNVVDIKTGNNINTTPVVIFYDGGNTDCGSIDVDPTANTTAYTTSSDYRLKENVQPMTNALAKIDALKPCTWTWKEGQVSGEGFIAHELQEVVPCAVTGEKDAIDDNGNPIYQGVDTSFLVATLTAAIQEQQVMINELKAKVAALESK